MVGSRSTGHRRMWRLSLFSLEKRNLRRSLIAVSNYLVSHYRKAVARRLLEVHNERTRDNSHKLQQEEFQLGMKKPHVFFLLSESGSALEQGSREAVEPLSSEVLKIQPNKAWRNLI